MAKDIRSRRNSERAVARRAYSLEGVLCERCGEEPAKDRHHIDGNTAHNARANLTFLCRRCHMEVDGRKAALVAVRLARPCKPAEPCGECGRPYKYLRRGLCAACAARRYRRALALRALAVNLELETVAPWLTGLIRTRKSSRR